MTAASGSTAAAALRAVRPEQWIKNVLVFVPMVLAHRVGDPGAWADGLAAFAALCAIASAGYLVNDVRDREHDRRHPRKRARPVACGALPAGAALGLAGALAAAGISVALAALPRAFASTLAVYAAGTAAYSLALKRIAILDVLALAGLYVVRLAAGGAATEVPLSPWLLAFAMFLFASLAVVKRYAELAAARENRAEGAPGRGYRVGDLALLRAVGVSAGTLSVLVLALYVLSTEVRVLYARPTVLLLACPALFYWILRVWMLADRGELDDDPVVFTVRDPVSWAIGAAVLAVLWFAV